MADSCNVCGGSVSDSAAIVGSDRLHGVAGTWEVRLCGTCGSGRTYPGVPEDRLGELYPSGYSAHGLPTHGAARLAATALFRARYWLALWQPPLSALGDGRPGRLLDVGSGRGDLGVVLGERGWQVVGLEPSREACAEAIERGVESVCGSLTGPAQAPVEGPFDAVVFQHSLEHVADPLSDLLAARELVRPRGLVLISVPNFSCWQRWRFGADWFHLDLPRHRWHLTAHGLAALLERVPLVVRKIGTSTSADGLPTSLQFRRYGHRRLERGPGRYAAFAATIAAFPLTALANALGGDGDVLHAVAERRD